LQTFVRDRTGSKFDSMMLSFEDGANAAQECVVRQHAIDIVA